MPRNEHFAWLRWVSCGALALMIGCTGDPGADGAEGPPGQDGQNGQDGQDGTVDPSVSAVTPVRVYLDRTIDVTISGDGTTWASGATVNFGAGIVVDNVIVASPTAIVATITVSDEAPLGARDVTVSRGGVTVTYAGAFRVEAPLTISSLLGTRAQGTILYAQVKQRDVSTPFDTRSENMLIQAGDSKAGIVETNMSPYAFNTVLFLDVHAPSGPTDIVAKSGLPGSTISSRAPAAFDAAARTPIPLVAGTPATGMVASPLESQLYSFDAAPNQIVSLSVSANSADATPLFALLPSSGKFDELIATKDSYTFPSGPTGGTYYVVYYDKTGSTGYNFTLSLSQVNSGEIEPNDTCVTAQAATLPISYTNLALSSKTDVDWFTVTVDAAAVGRKLRVVTSPGDDETDTRVDVLASDCTTSLGGPSSDTSSHENFTSTAIPAAGVYYIKIYYSNYPYIGAFYNLNVTLVP